MGSFKYLMHEEYSLAYMIYIWPSEGQVDTWISSDNLMLMSGRCCAYLIRGGGE